jgi:hypothetical protein
VVEAEALNALQGPTLFLSVNFIILIAHFVCTQMQAEKGFSFLAVLHFGESLEAEHSLKRGTGYFPKEFVRDGQPTLITTSSKIHL